MRNALTALYIYLKDSFWFAPLAMSVGAWILASVLLSVDRTQATINLTYFESVESARTVLSTIAASSITVAGSVFSLVMVVLVLASQQYGPLVVSTLSRDRTLQSGMGVFTASFVYCLRVLQSLEVGFLAPLASNVGILIGFANVVLLIFVLHRLSSNIRYNNIISNIMGELHETVGELFPRVEPPVPPALPTDHRSNCEPVYSTESGYLELVDKFDLVALATQADCIISLRYRPGTFVFKGAIIGWVHPAKKATPELAQQINESLYVGNFRTPEQDIELMVTQLATIAVRALSPAVNDPYTAMSCIDRLGEALSDIGARPNPQAVFTDMNGKVRLVTRPATFASLLSLAFDQIRHYGKGDLKVMLHLLKTIGMVGESLHDKEDETILRGYAKYIRVEALALHKLDYEMQRIEAMFLDAVGTLAD
jgi:uncharacterized membrane protein